MDFRRRAATTGKVELPDAVKEEVDLSFYYNVVQKTKHNILIDHESRSGTSKFVPGSKATQAKIGSTTVPIAGSTALTLTFVTA